jgi:hypothetical protein
MVPPFHKTLELVLPTLSLCQMHDYVLNCYVSVTKWSKLYLYRLWVKMTFENIKLSLQVITPEVWRKFIYVATQIMEFEGRVWKLQSLRSWERLAELAVFTGCSCGVVCFTSYRQSEQSGIFEPPNSMLIRLLYQIWTYIIDKRTVLFWVVTQRAASIYCRRLETILSSRVFLTLSVNILPKFRDKILVTSSSVFLHLVVISCRLSGEPIGHIFKCLWFFVVISYWRFRTTYWSHLQVYIGL